MEAVEWGAQTGAGAAIIVGLIEGGLAQAATRFPRDQSKADEILLWIRAAPPPCPTSPRGHCVTTLSTRSGGGLKFLDKLLQLFAVDIAHGPEIEALLRPELYVEPLHGLHLWTALGAGALGDE